MENRKINILYEDEDVVAIEKPAGLSVHGDGKNENYVLTDWVIENYPDIKGVGEIMTINGKEIERPGIVHRLDKDTSGVMLVAKNQKFFAFLKAQFKNREIIKKYYALVHGEIIKNSGVINRPIGRSAKDSRMRSAQRGAKGKMRDAETEYKKIIAKKDYSFLELLPKTGRTHQLRVHLKAIDHPILCDSLYAGKRGSGLGMKGLALHAGEISFYNLDGKKITVVSAIPKEIKNAVAKLKIL